VSAATDNGVGEATADALDFAGAMAPMVVAVRSGLRESVHVGAGVAFGPDGTVIATLGDPDLVVYPRSCLKPLQADAMVAFGLDLPDDQLAVACASHDGSDTHLAVVRSILSDHDLTEDDLENTPARPYGAAARSAARAAGVAPSAIQQNCSGKHAAMLATCRVNDWPTAGYVARDHPLQRAIVEHLRGLGASVAHVGVDGCGAPTHAVTLRDLARAYASLAVGRADVARAMASHPDLVGGPGRDVSLWMRAIDGLMAKEGAAGVMAAALPDGRAVVFKVADGSDVARRSVTPQALREVGIDVDIAAPDTVRDTVVPVLGHGEPVGRFEPLGWSR